MAIGRRYCLFSLVLSRVSAIPPIITHVATSVPYILANLTAVAAEFNRIGPDLSPIGAQFRWRRAFAPVLAILAHIRSALARVLANLATVAANLARVRPDFPVIGTQFTTLAPVNVSVSLCCCGY